MRQQGSKSGLLRFARNDGKTQPRYLAAHFARVLLKVPLSEIRGRRECRAPDAPAASRAKVESTRVSHHGHAGSPGIPRAMVLRFPSRSPRCPGLFATVANGNVFRQLDASVG